MRWIAIFVCLFMAGTGAAAEERPMLQLDTGGHMAVINALAFTPDGHQLVSASDDKTIRVWDMATGKTARTIRGEAAPGPAGKVYAMALSPDGRWLAAGGMLHNSDPIEGSKIRLYDFATGKLVALLKGHEDVVLRLAFSPDGRLLVSGSQDNTAIIWDVAAARALHRLRGHTDLIYAVGFTPDGQRAVTGSYDHDLRLWRVADGSEIAKMPGHGDNVRSVAVAPDGTIASGDWSGEIRLWDGKTGAFRKVLAQQKEMVGSLSFSPDGKRLLSSCGQGLPCHDHVWDRATGAEIATHKIDENIVLATAISPDGRSAATGGGNNHEIHIWDLQTGERRKGADGQPLTLGGSGRPVWAVGFAADGRRIAWGHTNGNLGGTTPINERGPLEYAATLPSGDAPLSGPVSVGEGTFLRAVAERHGWSLAHHGSNYGGNGILELLKDGKPSGVSITRGSSDGYQHRSYTFTPDGETVISGGGNGVLTAYDRAGNKLGDFIGHESDVFAIAPSYDGRYLVSGSDDQTIRLWNLKTRELLVTIFRGEGGEWVIWTPEGFYAGSQGADKIEGWQVNQGPDKAARYITAGQLRKALHRPDLVAAKIAGDPDGLVKEAAARLNIDALIRESLAPMVAILSPENGSKAKEFDENGKTIVRVAVAARITDGGGGIGKITFKLNGQAVASAYGALMLDKDGTLTRSFNLSTPDTSVEVVAEDKDGKAESLPAAITLHADAKALQGVPDLYVLAIGANRYRDLSKKLNFAVPDAEALANTLKQAGVGYYRHPPIVKTLFDDEVAAEKIGATFEALSAQVKAGDVFVFYIAGHGKTLKAGADYYYLPPSMEGFSDEQIAKQGFGPEKLSAWFEKIAALKSIWIFDTCESGSAERIKAFRVRDAALDDAALQRLKDATGRTIFMAASEQQSAVEGYRNHGLFTYALLEGFAKAGSGEQVQLFDLADYVQSRVPALSRELNACEAKATEEYCQKPIVTLGHTPNYPVLRRYPQVLAMLGAEAPQISTKTTHIVIHEAEVFAQASRGPNAVHRLVPGDQVHVVEIEGAWAKIAQQGRVIGYVEQDRLLKLNP